MKGDGVVVVGIWRSDEVVTVEKGHGEGMGGLGDTCSFLIIFFKVSFSESMNFLVCCPLWV